MKHLVLTALIAMSGCAGIKSLTEAVQPQYEAQADCGFAQNVQGERQTWQTLPIQLSVHESFPSAYIPALQAAAKDWETAVGKPLFQFKDFGVKGPMVTRRDGVNLVYYFKTWDPSRQWEQGTTDTNTTGNAIKEADIRLDAAYTVFYLDAPAHPGDVHLESVLVHELGHVLGLKHTNANSVMNPTLAPNTIRTAPTQLDINNIHCGY